MDIKPNNTIVFHSLSGGYHCLAIASISNYMFDDHLEVHPESIQVFHHPKNNINQNASHRVGYGDIKMVVDNKYLSDVSQLLEDYPELLI